MGAIEWAWFMAATVQAQVEGRLRWRKYALAQSTVEYALVGALVVLAAATAMSVLGGEIGSVFTRITTQLTSAASASR